MTYSFFLWCRISYVYHAVIFAASELGAWVGVCVCVGPESVWYANICTPGVYSRYRDYGIVLNIGERLHRLGIWLGVPFIMSNSIRAMCRRGCGRVVLSVFAEYYPSCRIPRRFIRFKNSVCVWGGPSKKCRIWRDSYRPFARRRGEMETRAILTTIMRKCIW